MRGIEGAECSNSFRDYDNSLRGTSKFYTKANNAGCI